MLKSYRSAFLLITVCCFCKASTAQTQNKPLLGWNSWDSYGKYPSEKAMMANLDVFVQKLKPYGYAYFVVDAGWNIEKDSNHNLIGYSIDSFGRYIPVKSAFPDGLQPLINAVHKKGLKFGIHIMRGIPREAYNKSFPVINTKYTARDIADTSSTCRWSKDNYGVDMSKPGAQEYYNSYISLLAGWGVDFIKADDITGHPEEINAVVKAIQKTGKQIPLSISPGGDSKTEFLDIYKQAAMLRITADVWDNQKSIDKVFDAWKKWSVLPYGNLLLDMDMIPFGHLAINNPDINYLHAAPHEGDKGTKAKERICSFSKDQMYTFITQRALGASPLFIGGDLPTTDSFSFSLITNKEMLACNQNGLVGKLVYDDDSIEVWKTPLKTDSTKGWIGIFNRSIKNKKVIMLLDDLHLKPCKLFDVWKKTLTGNNDTSVTITIAFNAVIFYRYEELN